MEQLKWELEVVEKKNEDRFRQIELSINKNKKIAENLKEDVERRIKDIERQVGKQENEIL